jgi:hypothetical protein
MDRDRANADSLSAFDELNAAVPGDALLLAANFVRKVSTIVATDLPPRPASIPVSLKVRIA